MFQRLSTNLYCIWFLPAARVEPFCGRLSSHVASILARLQAKRECGDYVLVSINKFMLCMILAGFAGGIVLPAAL